MMTMIGVDGGKKSRPARDLSVPRAASRIDSSLWHTDLLFYLCAFVIVASLVLGGGTRSGFLSDAILQLIAIPLLFVALWRLLGVPLTKQMQIALFFCAALVAIPLLQLIPLPPWLWSALPGREPAVEASQILGENLSWMPISLSPNETWLSALSLIPPIAIFLATFLSSYRERRWLSLVFLGVGIVSVILGLLQVAQGQASMWRFYATTNPLEAVGFFANKNHFAALLYCVILLAAAWMVTAAAKFGQQPKSRTYDASAIIPMIATFTLLVALLAGEAIARSRMGLLLTILALFGAIALALSDRSVRSTVNATRLVVGAGVLALIFSSQFALYGIMERFVSDPLKDYRMRFGRVTVEAAIANMPFGSGLGTFVPVYAMFEQPEDAMLDVYANHAHNDVLEIWLTTGVIGLVLLGMFVVWLFLQSVEIWRRAPALGANELDWNLARAATLVVAFLVVHSLFDYPLRTGAMMAVMAFACGLLIEPPYSAQTLRTSALEKATTSLSKMAKDAPAPAFVAQKPPPLPKPASMPVSKTTSMPVSKPIPGPHGLDPFRYEMEERLGHVRRALAGDALERAGGVDVDPTLSTAPKPPMAMPLSKPASTSSAVGGLSPDQRWGTDIDWPDEWAIGKDRPPNGPKSPKGS